MNSKEVLEKAIKKATDNFWGTGLAYIVEPVADHMEAWIRSEEDPTKKAGNAEFDISIYDKSFAKALWGEAPTDIKGFELQMPEWKRQLQYMVISDDPIKYLGENIQ